MHNFMADSRARKMPLVSRALHCPLCGYDTKRTSWDQYHNLMSNHLVAEHDLSATQYRGRQVMDMEGYTIRCTICDKEWEIYHALTPMAAWVYEHFDRLSETDKRRHLIQLALAE